MRGFEVGIDHDDITSNLAQAAQHPFEIRSKWSGRDGRRTRERSTNERDPVPDRWRNPYIHAYRSESIGRTSQRQLAQ